MDNTLLPLAMVIEAQAAMTTDHQSAAAHTFAEMSIILRASGRVRQIFAGGRRNQR